MNALRRLTALAMAAMLQVPLGTWTPHCATLEGMASQAMSHEGMSMPSDGATADAANCESCAPVSDDTSCEHGLLGACASMSSCGTLAVETQWANATTPSPVERIIASTADVPSTLSFSPDPPPPRV